MGCVQSYHKNQTTQTLPKVAQITEVATLSSLDTKIIADFIAQVRPLDLIVFRGRDTVSNVIRTLENLTTGNGEISHVEVAITMDWCSEIKPLSEFNVKPTTMLSWGSTMSGSLNDGAVNIETGAGTFGVQFRVLENLIKHYLTKPTANVGLCRLLDNPTCQRRGESLGDYTSRTLKLREDLNRAYAKYDGRLYNANPLALLGAMFPAVRQIRDGASEAVSKFIDVNKWLFCSELVANVYIETGVITDATDGVVDGKVLDSADVLPVDFLGVDNDGIKNNICDTDIMWIKK